MKVYAPFDGTVVTKGAEKGETITPGGMGAASGRGSVVKLANLSILDVETDVSEGLLGRIEVGQPAEISVSAVPNKRYKGHLRTIIPMGDRAKGTVMVKVAIDDPDEKLFPELAATVHFLPNTSKPDPETGKSYLFVQKSGIVEENGQFYAWVVDPKTSMLDKRAVEVVIANDLARIEKGLSPGDVVVNNPPKTLRAGEIVKEAN
jgi:RND family efflux transporter MFP subunit